MNQAPLLVELFTEELPPKSLKLLGEQFSKKLFERLITNGLVKSGTSYRSFATPRRLAIYIDAVLPKAADQRVQEKLLPVSIGLDPQGHATAPLLKKLQALGMKDVPVDQLERSGTGKNEVLSLQIQKIGLDLQSGLQDALDFAVQQLPIAKTMHYQLNAGTPEEVNVQFVRPAHGLIALYDALIIPVHVLGLTAGNTTQGHRFLSPGMITIDHAKNYETILLNQGKVLANFDDRLQSIDRQLHMAAGAHQVLKPQSLLEEVTALVEWPVVYTCHFEEAFLEVEAKMKKHVN
jgi:glycyl-tRNA synthetase beta chain